MKKYQYQLVRYVHDRLTAEFVNVGVIIFQPESKILKSCFIGKYGRITQFFSELNGHSLLITLKQFEQELNVIAKRTGELFFEFENIDQITNSILQKDDSALICSEVFYGVDIDVNSALSDLYERLVNRYNPDTEVESHDDKYVWKNIYKRYFDKYEITKNLKPYTVQTSHDSIHFDKAWKNGSWHCYQALSFDLKREESIKNKVYKWSGILNELNNSNEELFIHFLTVSPSKHKSIQKFIDDTFLQKELKSIKVSLVKEDEAEQFASSVNQEISKHNN